MGRRLIVDGVRVEGAEARRILRRAFVEATQQRGTSVKLVRTIAMVLGGLLGGALLLAFTQVPGLASARYVWLYIAGAFLVVAFTTRFIARRVLFRVYRTEIRLAMQRLGFELCLDCGYWLKGLPDDEPHCPECGAKRRRLGP